MDSKMIKVKGERLKVKGVLSVLCILCSVLFYGCKQNEWMDWKLQNDLWLAQNKTQPGVKTTASGLQYRILEDPGKANGEAQPNATSTIVCDYSVKLINDHYIQKDVKNAAFDLSSTIPGFSEGCHKIHNHGDIELFIPAYLGYDYERAQTGKYGKASGSGTEGNSSYIPPYSVLIYTIHLSNVSGN